MEYRWLAGGGQGGVDKHVRGLVLPRVHQLPARWCGIGLLELELELELEGCARFASWETDREMRNVLAVSLAGGDWAFGPFGPLGLLEERSPRPGVCEREARLGWAGRGGAGRY